MVTAEKLFGTRLCPVNQKELARIAGVNQSTVCRWRKNPGSIPWEKMKILIRVRGLTADDLMKMAKEQ
jgi:hypothetical protein